MKKQRIINVDVVRLIISFLVVAIHTYPLSFISDDVDFALTRLFCRICVPFFLMITGYFVMDKALKDRSVLARQTKKIAIMYLISMVIYLPILIYTGYFKDFSWWLFIKDVLVDGFYFHLWYFPALILGSWLTYILIKKVDLKVVGVVLSVLFFIGLMGDNYYGFCTQIPFVKTFYDAIFTVTHYTRNGLFYAPMFIYIGYMVKIHKNESSRFKYLTFGIISLILMMVEGMLVHTQDWPRHTTMYFFLAPTCYFLFKFMMNSRVGSNEFLREVSTWIYIMHPFFVTGVRFLGNMFHIEIIYKQSALYFILVLIISFAFSYCLVWAKKKFLDRGVRQGT